MPGPGTRLIPAVIAATALTWAGCVPPAVSPASVAFEPPSPAPSVAPSRPPTPSPTADPPTPSASSTPDPSILELDATSCDGGVVLEWSATSDPAFHHYTALRSPEREIAPDWPPIAPAVDWGDTYATDRFVTSAVDASIIPSETRWFYRVMAYDADNEVLAASPVRGARLGEVLDLGEVEATDLGDGATRLAWQPYEGFSGCFSSYRVLIGSGAPTTLLATISGQGRRELETEALHPGTTYQLRVEAVRTTTLGSFVVAATKTTTYTVP